MIKNSRVAIIEDDSIISSLFMALCEELELRVSQYISAEAFYEKALEGSDEELEQWWQDLELVITDVNLEADSGFDVCRRLKENHLTREIPIMFVSGVDDVETIADAYEAGATAYITKPIIAPQFIAHVKSLVQHSLLTKSLKSAATNARSIAFNSMIESERLQSIIHFVCFAHECKNFHSLSQLVFETLISKMNIRSSLLFHLEEDNIFYTDDGKEHEFEKRFLMQLQDKVKNSGPSTRFFITQDRMGASFEYCSIFVRSSGDEKVESLLDYLGIFMGYLDQLIEQMISDQKVLSYVSSTTQTLTLIKSLLSDVDASQSEGKAATAETLAQDNNRLQQLLNNLNQVTEALGQLDLQYNVNPSNPGASG